MSNSTLLKSRMGKKRDFYDLVIFRGPRPTILIKRTWGTHLPEQVTSQEPHQNNTKSLTSILNHHGDVDLEMVVQLSLFLLLNIAISVFFLSKRSLRIKPQNQLFINMLCVHIIFTVLGISFEYQYSYVNVIISNGLFTAMFTSLMVLSLERVIAIKSPFRHQKLSGKDIIIAIALSWLPPFIFILSTVFSHITQWTLLLLHTIVIITSFITLTTCSLMIYCVAKKHDNFVKTHQRSNINYPNKKKILKSSLACLVIVLSFVTLWFPFLIHNLLSLGGFYVPGKGKMFSDIVEHVGFLNCFVDPILVIWLNRGAKEEVWKMLKMNKLKEKERKEKKGSLTSLLADEPE